MALEETLTGNGASAEFTPAGNPTEVMVFGFTGSGSVSLIEKLPSGTEYNHGTIRGTRAVVTPDTGNSYYFQAHDVEGDVTVYAGP